MVAPVMLDDLANASCPELLYIIIIIIVIIIIIIIIIMMKNGEKR